MCSVQNSYWFWTSIWSITYSNFKFNFYRKLDVKTLFYVQFPIIIFLLIQSPRQIYNSLNFKFSKVPYNAGILIFAHKAIILCSFRSIVLSNLGTYEHFLDARDKWSNLVILQDFFVCFLDFVYLFNKGDYMDLFDIDQNFDRMIYFNYEFRLSFF